MNAVAPLAVHAREAPGAAAILAPPGARSLDRASLRDAVAGGARALARLGVERGDRVALLALNEPQTLVAMLALAWRGAVAVPLNWRLHPDELREQIADAGAPLLLVGHGLEALGAEAGAGVARRSLDEDEDDGGSGHDVPVDVRPDEVLGIFYTGGTTGRAKGVVLTHANLLANAAHLQRAIGYSAADVHLHAAPMFHLADLGYTWVALMVGASHAFLPRWSPEGFLESMARHRATMTLLAPVMVAGVLAQLPPALRDLDAWRLLHYGGAPIGAETLSLALSRLPCELVQGYGQTEATHTICLLTPAEHRAALAQPERLAACGRPIAGVEVRVVDGEGRPCGAGQPGELCARGPTVMPGYWRRPRETAEALREGWLRTGDVARVDGEGFVYLLDRLKDMIVTGGENVFSAEVERALAAHPAVREAAVIGVPDAVWGERVHAVVVLAPGAGAAAGELEAHCRARVGGYKVPRSFEFRPELPRNAAGKIQKAELRAPHWSGRNRAIG